MRRCGLAVRGIAPKACMVRGRNDQMAFGVTDRNGQEIRTSTDDRSNGVLDGLGIVATRQACELDRKRTGDGCAGLQFSTPLVGPEAERRGDEDQADRQRQQTDAKLQLWRKKARHARGPRGNSSTAPTPSNILSSLDMIRRRRPSRPGRRIM